MILFPNAKINIGLKILRKRPDAYHDLESVFYPVQLRDILEILPDHPMLNDKGTEISAAGPAHQMPDKIFLSGLPLPASPENLCLKAVQLFRKQHEIPEVRIHLHKKIPAGSGLGGGSSDASFTLLALNAIFDCGLTSDLLEQYASQLGSDCPFFIKNSPMLASGRGDILDPVPLSLAGYHLVIVFPEISVSTSEAYRMVLPSGSGPFLRDIIQRKPEEWKGHVCNCFEEAVFARHPEIGRIKESLDESGAVYASMSGSGSAVYGIFRKQPQLNKDLQPYKVYQEVMI